MKINFTNIFRTATILFMVAMSLFLFTGTTTSQVQPEILFDNTATMTAFSPKLDGMLCYTKDAKIHWVYDASISDFKPVTATSIIFSQTNSVTVTNTTTETSLFGTGGGIKTLPIGFFNVGRTIRIKLLGFRSRSSGNETYRIYIGGVAVFTTGAILLGAGSNDGIDLECAITLRSTGVTGTAIGAGRIINWSNGNLTPFVTITTPFTINTTISNTIDVTVQWGTANAGNTETITNGLIFI